MLRQCVSRSPRQPNGLRAVTHTKERGRLIAQLIDLHQRSQEFARKGGNASHDITACFPARRGEPVKEERLIPTRGGGSLRGATRGAHTFTHSPLCTPYSSQALTVYSRSLTKFSSYLIIILTSSLSQRGRRSH